MHKEHPRNLPLPQRVLEAAVKAWGFHGMECHIEEMGDVAGGLFASLITTQAHHIEFVLDCTVEAKAWNILANWPRSDSSRLRALVPLSLLGEAHQHLSEQRFELQGWWIERGQVAFGSVEIA